MTQLAPTVPAPPEPYQGDLAADAAMHEFARGIITTQPDRFFEQSSPVKDALVKAALSPMIDPENYTTATIDGEVAKGAHREAEGGARRPDEAATAQSLGARLRAANLTGGEVPRPYASGAMKQHVKEHASNTRLATEKAAANPRLAAVSRREYEDNPSQYGTY